MSAEVEPSQLEAFSKLFSKSDIPAHTYWCREGEEASSMGIVLVGALAVQNDSDDRPTSFFLPGDIIGDIELCGPRFRNSAVRAIESSVIANINYEELTRFIEGMGLKRAKRVTKIIADDVLERVKQQKARLEEQVVLPCVFVPVYMGRLSLALSYE